METNEKNETVFLAPEPSWNGRLEAVPRLENSGRDPLTRLATLATLIVESRAPKARGLPSLKKSLCQDLDT
jgi:hypothetical protein